MIAEKSKMTAPANLLTSPRTLLKTLISSRLHTIHNIDSQHTQRTIFQRADSGEGVRLVRSKSVPKILGVNLDNNSVSSSRSRYYLEDVGINWAMDGSCEDGRPGLGVRDPLRWMQPIILCTEALGGVRRSLGGLFQIFRVIASYLEQTIYLLNIPDLSLPNIKHYRRPINKYPSKKSKK